MSEKSFAITSITAAVICGTFFYPPPPATANDGVKVVAAASRSAPAVTPAKEQPHGLREMALLQLGSAPRAKTVATLAAATPSARD